MSVSVETSPVTNVGIPKGETVPEGPNTFIRFIRLALQALFIEFQQNALTFDKYLNCSITKYTFSCMFTLEEGPSSVSFKCKEILIVDM